MPRLADQDAIRDILQRDPAWCVYALGDLSPRMFAKCAWFTPDLALVLHDYGTCILFAMGTASLDEALAHVTYPVHLQVQQDAFEHVARVARIERPLQMWRMAWQRRSLPQPDARARRLGADDVAAVQKLYADGEPTGESPDFFYPSMIADGVFYGVYEAEVLTAVAGTHLVSREEGAAALGNIYTRRDRRGRGLARVVTSAVLHELQDVETIGLNVRADNAAALAVYAALGFARHRPFYEAVAHQRSHP